MQVGTGAASADSNVSNHLAARDALTGYDGDGCHVSIERRDSMAVVQNRLRVHSLYPSQRLATTASPVAWIAVPVGAAMSMPRWNSPSSPANGSGALAEGTGDASHHRPQRTVHSPGSPSQSAWNSGPVRRLAPVLRRRKEPCRARRTGGREKFLYASLSARTLLCGASGAGSLDNPELALPQPVQHGYFTRQTEPEKRPECLSVSHPSATADTACEGFAVRCGLD